VINIIRYKPHDTNILSRKAQVLVKALDWSISDQPDSGAFVNYAFPYLNYRGDTPLPFAAYFTHREDCIPGKVDIWKEQARKAVLRVTSAQQYYDDLSQYGPTAKILPPLDRGKFSPPKGDRPIRNRPVVGVAGFVYRGGRKGEELVERASKTLSGFEFRAMGTGWPVLTTKYPYNKIQEFYHDLDIFLCSSMIEGIPYPPLEALACGVRIVIPKGVGLLDELPDIPGIERYEAGNLTQMQQAIQRVAEIEVSRTDLRACTEIFSEATWAKEHEEAFNEYEDLFVQTVEKSRATRRKDRGIYVVASGYNAARCARRLVRSVREQMPDYPVAVASDRRLPEADIHIDLPGDIDVGARLAKLRAYQLVPKQWDKVLYLDADTELVGDTGHMFDCLEAGWEMVFTKDVNSRHTVKYLYRQRAKQEYEQLLQLVGSEEELALAGGVWAFRRCAGAEAFLDAWLEEWGEGKYRDQVPMLSAFYKAKVRGLILGNEWNSFTKLAHENRYQVIRHYSGGTARDTFGVMRKGEVLVINTTDWAIERGGLLFVPGVAVLVNSTRSSYQEIKACPGLQVCR